MHTDMQNNLLEGQDSTLRPVRTVCRRSYQQSNQQVSRANNTGVKLNTLMVEWSWHYSFAHLPKDRSGFLSESITPVPLILTSEK